MIQGLELRTLVEILLAVLGLERKMAVVDDKLTELRTVADRISTDVTNLLGKVGTSGLTDAQTEVLNQTISTLTAAADSMEAALGTGVTGTQPTGTTPV